MLRLFNSSTFLQPPSIHAYHLCDPWRSQVQIGRGRDPIAPTPFNWYSYAFVLLRFWSLCGLPAAAPCQISTTRFRVMPSVMTGLPSRKLASLPPPIPPPGAGRGRGEGHIQVRSGPEESCRGTRNPPTYPIPNRSAPRAATLAAGGARPIVCIHIWGTRLHMRVVEFTLSPPLVKGR